MATLKEIWDAAPPDSVTRYRYRGWLTSVGRSRDFQELIVRLPNRGYLQVSSSGVDAKDITCFDGKGMKYTWGCGRHYLAWTEIRLSPNRNVVFEERTNGVRHVAVIEPGSSPRTVCGVAEPWPEDVECVDRHGNLTRMTPDEACARYVAKLDVWAFRRRRWTLLARKLKF
jgi:hypothetical protein